LALFGLLGTLALATHPARADAEADAKDLFQRGRDLREKGNCAEASPLFRKATQIYPQGLGSLRNLAECEEELGRWASARRAWLDLSRALLTTQDAKYKGWDHDAETAAARLAPKVAKLTVEVTVASPEGEAPANEKSPIEVLLNGEALPLNLVNTLLERDPGAYRVRVMPKRGQPVEQSVTLAAGEAKKIALRVEVPAEPKAKPSGPVDVGPTFVEPEDKAAGRRTAGWIALGVGGASLVAMGVFIGVRGGALGDLESVCPKYESQPCGTNAQDAVDRGKSAATMANVFGIIGGVGVAAGAVLLLTSPKPQPIVKAGVRVYATLGGAAAEWRFQ
jgi:hypothetical protein